MEGRARGVAGTPHLEAESNRVRTSRLWSGVLLSYVAAGGRASLSCDLCAGARFLVSGFELAQPVASGHIDRANETFRKESALKILVAITGASGILYAQRLLDNLDPSQHEVHVVQQLRASSH